MALSKLDCTAAHQKRSQKQTNLGMTRVRLSSIAREKAATICARHSAVSTAQQAAQGPPQLGTHPSALFSQMVCRSRAAALQVVVACGRGVACHESTAYTCCYHGDRQRDVGRRAGGQG